MAGVLRRFADSIAPERKDPPPDAPPMPGARLLAGLAGIILAAIMASLDESLGAAGTADLLGGFGYGPDEGSWINSAYALGNIAIIPLTPWLAQVFSVRRLAAVLLSLGVVASTACPVAPDYATAMGCRFLQGLGEGAMLPLLLLSLLRFLPPWHRPATLLLYGLVVTLASLLANPLEGVIGDLFTWRALFWVAPALGPVALFLVLLGLPEEEYNWQAFRETDYFGLFSLVMCTGSVSIMLGQGQRLDWFDSGFIDAMAACAGFFLIAFLVNEAVTKKPLFKESLFRNRNLVMGLMLILAFTIAVLGTNYLYPQEQTMIQHLREIQIGKVSLRLVIPLLLMAPLQWLAVQVLDVRLVIGFGLALCAFGNWLCVWITPAWYGSDFQPFLVVQVASWLLVLTSNTIVTTSALGKPDLLTGSAFFNIFRVLGTAFGTALLDAVVTVRERVHSDNDLVAGLNPGRYVTVARLAVQGPARLEQAERAQSTVMSFADAYGCLAVIVVCSMVFVLLQGPTQLVRKPK